MVAEMRGINLSSMKRRMTCEVNVYLWLQESDVTILYTPGSNLGSMLRRMTCELTWEVSESTSSIMERRRLGNLRSDLLEKSRDQP